MSETDANATEPDGTAEPSAEEPQRQVGLLLLSLLALGIGLLTGVGAALLRALMALIHNLFFLGEFSFYYDANTFDPGNPWGAGIILVPVIGGLGVVYLVRRFAPEARGHGVPEVMDAVYYNRGRMRPIVVLIKSLASALSIGSGASVGREGPIIQIGSGIGSSVGQAFALSRWQTITLLAAGAGAGIAATFNTPLGGVMFAIELILPEVSSRTFLPVSLATGAATAVGWLFFGFAPAFMVPIYGSVELNLSLTFEFFPLYLALGGLCGLASALFVWGLDSMEDVFDRLPGNDYIQNVIGMFGLGVMIYLFQITLGHAHVAGVGYATIQSVLTGEMTAVWVLALLFFAKLLATTVSLGAGASGGIFSPSLFLGVTLGGAFGGLLAEIWPNLITNPVEFAVIGMAGVVGGATGASMTAILMIFEMTQNYHAIVPAIITVACAVGLRRALSEENIYTIKLAARGHRIPKTRQSPLFLIRHAEGVRFPVAGRISLKDYEAGSIPQVRDEAPAILLVTEGKRVVGFISTDPDDPRAGQLIREFVLVREDDFLREVARRMARHDRQYALLLRGRGAARPDKITGMVSRRRLGDIFLQEFSE